MVLQVPARDQKFIDHTQYHTITQLYSHIVQETGPLDTVYIIIHHCPSFSIIVHHESKQVASLHLLARNPLTASGDNWLPAFCFMSSRCSLWLRLLLRRLTCQELWNMFEAVECDRLRDEDDQFKDKIDRSSCTACCLDHSASNMLGIHVYTLFDSIELGRKDSGTPHGHETGVLFTNLCGLMWLMYGLCICPLCMNDRWYQLCC